MKKKSEGTLSKDSLSPYAEYLRIKQEIDFISHTLSCSNLAEYIKGRDKNADVSQLYHNLYKGRSKLFKELIKHEKKIEKVRGKLTADFIKKNKLPAYPKKHLRDANIILSSFLTKEHYLDSLWQEKHYDEHRVIMLEEPIEPADYRVFEPTFGIDSINHYSKVIDNKTKTSSGNFDFCFPIYHYVIFLIYHFDPPEDDSIFMWKMKFDYSHNFDAGGDTYDYQMHLLAYPEDSWYDPYGKYGYFEYTPFEIFPYFLATCNGAPNTMAKFAGPRRGKMLFDNPFYSGPDWPLNNEVGGKRWVKKGVSPSVWIGVEVRHGADDGYCSTGSCNLSISRPDGYTPGISYLYL